MNIDALLLLQRSDIAHFCANASAFEPIKKIFIDPGVMEDALAGGLDSRLFQFRRLDVGSSFQARVTSEAWSLAVAIDIELTRERERLFGEGTFQGWDHALLRLFLIRAMVARNLGDICSDAFAGQTIGLLRPTRPQVYYFDSFLTTELFAAGRSQWPVVGNYDTTRNWVETLDACFDSERIRDAACRAEAITHIPTCYADGNRFIAEITERFPTNVDLPSVMWDIPVRRTAPPLLIRRAAAEQRYPEDASAAATYAERARGILDRHFAALPISAIARRVQTAHLAGRSRVQALNFLGLRRALQGRRPDFVLADQDAGNNGPLFSVAAALGSRITVLPHSSYPTSCLPHVRNVTAVERNGYRTPVRSILNQRVAMRSVDFGAAAPMTRERVRVACLLLNTMCSEGLSYIDFFAMADFHKTLAQLCADVGVELLVRIKPGSGSPSVVSGLLGIPREHLDVVSRVPIDEVAKHADLCVSYGEPTTACIRFLEAGGYVINTNEQQWPSDYSATPAIVADGTIPALPGDQSLTLVESVLGSAAAYRRRVADQQREFRARLQSGSARLFTAPEAEREKPPEMADARIAHVA